MSLDICEALDFIQYKLEQAEEQKETTADIEQYQNVLSCLMLLDDVYAAYMAISHLYNKE